MLQRMSKMPLAWLLASVICCLAWPAHAGVEVMAAASARNTVSLNGLWDIKGEGFASQAVVPGAIPLTGTVTHWSRSFTMALAARPAVAYIEFAGIVNTAVVRLNGVQVGTLVALKQTRLDVSAALVLNGSNKLEVDIDDKLTDSTVPGGFTDPYVATLGALAYQLPVPWEHRPGIVRDVTLVWSARPIVTDVFATSTLNADLSRSDVTVRLRIGGGAPSQLAAFVGLTRGSTMLANCVAKGPAAGSTAAASNDLVCSFSVAQPVLWSPEQPQLHDLFVTLYDGPQASDAVHDRIGFRRIETRGNQLFLNNRALFLRGISRHDLYGDAGFVANPEAIETDLRFIKKLGANYVRSIHYPPDERVAKRADEIGLLLSEEIPAWAKFIAPGVSDIAIGMFGAMIERDYNRPSVIFWFGGSESSSDDMPYFKRVAQTGKALDPTRLVSFVFDTPIYKAEDVQRYAKVARDAGFDVYAQNGYGLAYDAVIRALPLDFVSVITEWSGSEGSDRGPIGPPGVHAFPDVPDSSGMGVFSELHETWSLMKNMLVWLPYMQCTAGSATPCVSGLVYFNWQDVPWAGLPYFVEGHVPVYHNGLVYADRTPKVWPLAAFEWATGLMPGDR